MVNDLAERGEASCRAARHLSAALRRTEDLEKAVATYKAKRPALIKLRREPRRQDDRESRKIRAAQAAREFDSDYAG